MATIGTTKSGKTTSIAVLTEVADSLLLLTEKDEERTKVTVEYHIDFETKEGIWIEEIDLLNQAIKGVADCNDVEDYNLQLRETEVLKSVLGLDFLEKGENVKKYVEQQMARWKSIEKPVELSQLKN